MAKMTTKAVLRRLRIAPRKVRLVADLVRGLSVRDAQAQLLFSSKQAARPVKKLIDSAVANAAHNHNMDTESLVIKEIYVDGAGMLKRWMPRAFGRATMIRKRLSHVTLVLEGTAPDAPAADSKTEKKDVKKDDTSKEKKAATKKPTKNAASKKATAKSAAKSVDAKKQ